jgi:uncharacterized protein (TIRG00374 family)
MIALVSSILFGIALAGLLFLLVREPLAVSIFQKFARLLPHQIAARLERMLGSFVIGLHSLKSARDVATIASLSLAIWTVESASYFLILSAFGLLPDLAIHAVAAVFTMGLINLGVMIPAAPGGVGPFEAAAIFALAAFGVNETLAASAALSSHTVQYLLVTGLGLLFVWREGISVIQPRDEDDP